MYVIISSYHIHLQHFTQTLTTLNLTDYRIEAAGAQYLADALRHMNVTHPKASNLLYIHLNGFL